jgi:hypothetical protein
MVGVFSRQWIEPLAHVLANLGSEAVWVVHGSDGLDEITTAGPTYVAALEHGAVRTFEVTPEEVGLQRAKPEALRGGDAKENAQALLDVLKGRKSAFRDVAVLNGAPRSWSPAAPRTSSKQSPSRRSRSIPARPKLAAAPDQRVEGLSGSDGRHSRRDRGL